MSKFDPQNLKRMSFRTAQVFDDTTFVFIAEDRAPWDWPNGKHFPKKTSALCYDARENQWSRHPLDHNGTRFASATGPLPPSGKSSIFFAGANQGEGFASILYACAMEDAFSVTQPERISFDKIKRVYDAKHIGDALYICGNEQTVLRRDASGTYARLSHKDGGRSVRKHEDWAAIDGTSQTDIYTTGIDRGEGSLFHFDGNTWRALPIPEQIAEFNGRAVICAPDGLVYAASHQGHLLRGNAKDGFEAVIAPQPGAPALGIDGPHTLVWFKGDLYLSAGWLYRLDKGAWTPVTSQSGFQPVTFDGLVSNDDVLLQYSETGASFFDGAKWHRIFCLFDWDAETRFKKISRRLTHYTIGRDAILDGLEAQLPY